MEPVDPVAPPVVAVMVVHEPGPWFDEVLEGVARQDHPNLRRLFLVVGEPVDLPARIRAAVPDAFVRAVSGNPGFGAAANEVLRLVEGENGFFCFLHDDVVLDDGAVRQLVDEIYRSNAGVVGPKLVDWRNPQVLQHVGLDVDRFGEVDPLVEPGEVDQEQHDSVRDVFAVPTACLLVRADLFRAVGGFDPEIGFHGDAVDLCWRVHLQGARVVVVPSARARHRERLERRRPDLPLTSAAARSRMRTVATLTGARRLPWVLLQLVFFTLGEVVTGIFTGRFRVAAAQLWALVSMFGRIPSYVARRSALRDLRLVPDAEVADLQVRGSARLTAYVRSRGSRPLDADERSERRWRESAGSAPVLVWFVLLALFVVGSRRIISSGVPRFGEFLPFPDSPARLWSEFLSGWSSNGLGSASPVPTALGLLAVASIGTLFHMGLLNTLAVLGLVVAGYLGVWRLATIFPTARARATALVVYAAVPLSSQALSMGRWSALVAYATVPWTVHLLRRVAGIDTRDHVDGDPGVETDRRADTFTTRRRLAQLALVMALAVAVAPAAAVVTVFVGVVLAGATALCGGSWSATWRVLAASGIALFAALVVNLPWVLQYMSSGGWTGIVGVGPVGARGNGVRALAEMRMRPAALGALSLALFVPVFAAPLIARSWRFAWSVRAAALVVVFGAVAVVDDRGLFPFPMPEPMTLLVPVALGIAIAAGCVAAAFENDVLAGSFGWRQPLGVVAATAAVLGVLPGVVTVGDGRWGMPGRTLQTALGELPPASDVGDYRVLWIGDPRAIPVGAWEFSPGVAYAVTDDGALTVEHRWTSTPTAAERDIAESLRRMAGGYTLRGGRLLAQYGIRYVMVPLADGRNGTITTPLQPPTGLVDVLDDQLDLAAPLTRPQNYLVYLNTAATSTRSMLTAEGAAASRQAGLDAVAQADLRGSVPFSPGTPDSDTASGAVDAGTLHLAVPFDRRWVLEVGGVEVPARRAFGTTMAFDVPAAGTAALEYRSSWTRTVWVLALGIAWAVLVGAATRLRWRHLVGWRAPLPELDDLSSIADWRTPFEMPTDVAAPVDVEGEVEPVEDELVEAELVEVGAAADPEPVDGVEPVAAQEVPVDSVDDALDDSLDDALDDGTVDEGGEPR